MKEAPVKRGDILAGKYRVESVLGVGGMGIVVEATHLELLEPRAIKLMLPEALESRESVERFLREARAASRLKSEHVARVHDVGHLDDGAPYMVMEFLEGTDLRTQVKERGRIPVDEATLYALQVCEALAEAHANGIVHRDLKPANLFLAVRPDGAPCVKVLDFGVSKIIGANDFEMTRTQTILGSPSYMSPEQMRSARTVDARTDIWSLGVILYRMITGQLPFRGENMTELVASVLSSKVVLPSRVVEGLPKGLDEVVLRCLERDLDKRYANVGELSSALLPFAPEIGQLSAERVARVLAGISLGGDTLPGGRRSSKGNISAPILPRAVSGTPSPWSSPAETPGHISMRPRTLALIGLGIAGVVSLGFLLMMGSRAAPTQQVAAAAPTGSAQPALQDTPTPTQAPIATAAAPSEPAAPAVTADPPAARQASTGTVPSARPATGKLKPSVASKPSAEATAPPPPPPAPPSTARNRMFGAEN
jgi:serine/threonine-protein kinase